MGKVLKASSPSAERYTVAIPVLAADAPCSVANDRPGSGEYTAPDEPSFAPGFELESAFALEPQFDIAAAHAQTQALIDDAARSAERLVTDAHVQARALIDEAQQQAAALGEAARRSAYEDGYAGGIQTANDEMAEMLDTLRGVLEATRGERHAVLTSAEPELVRLALGIAERVLHQQVALDNGVVVEMARAAIARIVDREKLTVRVNPADVDRMREHREALLALGDVKTMRVIEDQRVDRGGVIVETDAGTIDAKIATQLSEVRKILHIVDDVVVAPAPLHARDEPAFAASRAS